MNLHKNTKNLQHKTCLFQAYDKYVELNSHLNFFQVNDTINYTKPNLALT